LPPEDADVSRLVRQFRSSRSSRDTEPAREHVAESWHDALDEVLDDAVETELERDTRRYRR
jgi:hypothetical protein